MPRYSTRRRVAFSASEMYALVADVERYPEFLPLCESLVVRSREPRGDATVLVATMGVGYKAIRERFTTRVTLEPEARKILVEYLDGPFRRLENRWRFLDAASIAVAAGEPVSTAVSQSARGGSEVDFFIDYEFRSMALGLLMGAMFDTAFRRFAEAFEDRARVVYGVRRPHGSV